jgi:hypothetical protein
MRHLQVGQLPVHQAAVRCSSARLLQCALSGTHIYMHTHTGMGCLLFSSTVKELLSLHSHQACTKELHAH